MQISYRRACVKMEEAEELLLNSGQHISQKDGTSLKAMKNEATAC